MNERSNFRNQQLYKVKENLRLLRSWAERLEKRLFNNDGVLDAYLISQIESQANQLTYNAAMFNGAEMERLEIGK